MSSPRTRSVTTLVAKGAAVATMVIMMMLGGASAAQASPGGSTSNSGDVTVQSCSGVGGGVWCRGYVNLANGNKRCYSDYRHDTKVHGARVAGGNKRAETWQNPGIWAKTSIEVSRSVTCSYAALV